tara:strand:- start:564 stop:764 length:201 start_codon:yes stop_codon:yes gene_type:complete
MPHNYHETILSNILLAVGTVTAGTVQLVELDLYLGIAVKMVSFVSLVIVIAINIDKLPNLIKKWRK